MCTVDMQETLHGTFCSLGLCDLQGKKSKHIGWWTLTDFIKQVIKDKTSDTTVALLHHRVHRSSSPTLCLSSTVEPEGGAVMKTNASD